MVTLEPFGSSFSLCITWMQCLILIHKHSISKSGGDTAGEDTAGGDTMHRLFTLLVPNHITHMRAYAIGPLAAKETHLASSKPGTGKWCLTASYCYTKTQPGHPRSSTGDRGLP